MEKLIGQIDLKKLGYCKKSRLDLRGNGLFASVMAIIRKIITILLTVWIIAVFACGFLAYFVTSHNDAGICDGLGRHLSEAPILARIFFGQDRMWAGWGWFIGDMAIFWGSLASAMSILSHLDSK